MWQPFTPPSEAKPLDWNGKGESQNRNQMAAWFQPKELINNLSSCTKSYCLGIPSASSLTAHGFCVFGLPL